MIIINKPFDKIKSEVKVFIDKCIEDNISALSGQSAFFMILSAIPFIMFAVSILSLIGRGATIKLPEMPADNAVGNYIIKIVNNTIANASSSTSIITAIVSLWTAGRGMYIITEGISRIYKLPSKNFWLVKRVFAMGYTTFMLIILVIFSVLLTFGSFLNAELTSMIKVVLPSWLGPTTILIFADILMILFMTLAMKLYLLGKVQDKRYTKFKVLLPGAIVTVVAWNIYIFGMRIYTKYFSTSSVYGSLGTIAVLMLMIYFMMYILLCGVELNYLYRDSFLNFKFKNLFTEKSKNT